MNMTFEQWLTSGEKQPCILTEKDHTYIFLRAAKSPDFDYLYCQRQYRCNNLRRKDGFDYAGIYYKVDGRIYNSQYALQEVLGDSDVLFPEEISSMQTGLTQTVRAMVEQTVGNDRRTLQISTLSDLREAERLDSYIQYRAHEEARAAFLNDTPLEDIIFHCNYAANDWTEDSLLEYIIDPVSYAEKEAAAYMVDHQNEMLSEFLGNDALRTEYEAILADPQLPVHFVKRIMVAVSAVSAKTVTVTVCKNGESFTFKTEADELRRDCTDHYWTWHIAAADRRSFEERFGRNAEYSPQEITCITYGKKAIYEKAL